MKNNPYDAFIVLYRSVYRYAVIPYTGMTLKPYNQAFTPNILHLGDWLQKALYKYLV